MTALNSEGLEKAFREAGKDFRIASELFICMDPLGCYYVSWSEGEHRQQMTSTGATHEARYHLSALPPVDGLEVVAWRWPEPMAEGSKFHSVTNAEPPCSGWQELATLSQASSVIAGLNKRIEELERARDDAQTANASLSRLIDELDPKFELSRTIARISSLEGAVDAFADICDELGCERDNEAGLIAARGLKEENKRLRKALDEIDELNRTAADENGHRWANSDMINQTIVLARTEDHNG